MLSGVFSKMESSLFASLPTSTNAVKAHNRISKSSTPEPLNIAMLMPYKEDMLAALEHLACLKGISTSYEDQSLEAQKRASKQNEARRKRRAKEDDDGEGPPNKQRDFQGMYVCMYKMHGQLTLQSVLHSLVLRPIYGKRVHTTAVVLYMNTVSYCSQCQEAKEAEKA